MNVLTFDSESSWAAGVATFWRDRLRTNPRLTMCLPTGLTPAPVYAEMVRGAKAGLVSFAEARAFALDEFGDLSSDDPGRTKNMLATYLIGQVDFRDGACHYLEPTAPDLAQHCQAYDTAAGGPFDIVLLGLGLNGHLGMNEPGSSADSPTRRVDLHESTIAASARYFAHDRLPRWGVTVGLGPILAAREVWVLATGAAKAEIVNRLLTGAVSVDLPASLLRRHHACSLFLDRAAASSL